MEHEIGEGERGGGREAVTMTVVVGQCCCTVVVGQETVCEQLSVGVGVGVGADVFVAMDVHGKRNNKHTMKMVHACKGFIANYQDIQKGPNASSTEGVLYQLFPLQLL